jgi:hypothetical protein
MTREEVHNTVVEVLVEIQQQSGRPISSIRSTTRPFGGLNGFDSINSVEATVLLEGRLHCELGSNPFLPQRGGQPPKIEDIVDRLCQTMSIQSGGKDI